MLGPPIGLASQGSDNRLASLAHLVFTRPFLHFPHITIELWGQRIGWAPLLIYSLRPYLRSPCTTMLWASPTHTSPLGLGWTPMWIRPSPSTSNTLHRTPPRTLSLLKDSSISGTVLGPTTSLTAATLCEGALNLSGMVLPLPLGCWGVSDSLWPSIPAGGLAALVVVNPGWGVNGS